MTELNQAMHLLASHPKAIFLGQGVAADGVATYASFDGIPMDRRIEFPVAEELNVGCAIGLALEGWLPIVVIPRFDFLFRAADAIFNHLDLLPEMSRGQFKPKVIIRTRVGSRKPLDAGPQHTKSCASAFRLMLTTVDVVEIKTAAEIMPVYSAALASERSTLVVENMQ